jgi:hypothetical protein
VADTVRRRTRIAALRFLSTSELLAEVPDPREVTQWVEDRLVAFNALRAVDQPYRDVLELHLFDELGHLEIAKEMGIVPGTARTWLWRGKSELAAAARPKRRKAGRRALVIPLGFGELDPMDRALFRALRDATRGDPTFGGGDGGEPPPPNSRPEPVAPRRPSGRSLMAKAARDVANENHVDDFIAEEDLDAIF